MRGCAMVVVQLEALRGETRPSRLAANSERPRTLRPFPLLQAGYLIEHTTRLQGSNFARRSHSSALLEGEYVSLGFPPVP